jgi:hypothetical protein
VREDHAEALREAALIRELFAVYEAGHVNKAAAECLFPETLIFNESWLLRAVLLAWKAGGGRSGLDFLPFPGDARLYSEGQLYTPFTTRFRGDKQAESHTHVDGIAGHLLLAGKSGIALEQDFKYIAAFEAKMYSPLAGGVTHAPAYDQISRTAACIVNAVLRTGRQDGYAAHLVVLYPEDSRSIDPARYTQAAIADQIAARTQAYLEAGGPGRDRGSFAEGWQSVFQNLQIWFVSWEEALAKIASDDLDRFYELCKQFNARDGRSRGTRVTPASPDR